MFSNPFSNLECQFLLRESSRAKRISLRVKPPNIVELVVPVGVSVSRAMKFAKEHQKWVEEAYCRMVKRLESNRVTLTSLDNFKTKYHALAFFPRAIEKGFVRINQNDTCIHYPQRFKETDDYVQELVQLAIRETYRQEAKVYLPPRIFELARMHGFKINKVSIRDSKGRWGSCSAQKNISLSLFLMSLPDHLIDYILLHELCHTVEMNHSARFYALLNKVSGGKSDELKQELKRFSIPR